MFTLLIPLIIFRFALPPHLSNHHYYPSTTDGHRDRTHSGTTRTVVGGPLSLFSEHRALCYVISVTFTILHFSCIRCTFTILCRSSLTFTEPPPYRIESPPYTRTDVTSKQGTRRDIVQRSTGTLDQPTSTPLPVMGRDCSQHGQTVPAPAPAIFLDDSTFGSLRVAVLAVSIQY